MSNLTKEEIGRRLTSVNIINSPSLHEADSLRLRQDSHPEGTNQIETVESQTKRFKLIQEDDALPMDFMATADSADSSQLLTPSPHGREQMEGEETCQHLPSSLAHQEDMHYSHSTSTILYPPKTAGTPTSLSDDDSEDAMAVMTPGLGPNPFSVLASSRNPPDVSGRCNYTLPPSAKDGRAAKAALLARQAAALESKRTKQAINSLANKAKLDAKYDAADAAAGITSSLSQTSIHPTADTESPPILVAHDALSEITHEIVVGPFRLHVQISKDPPTLDGLLKAAGKLRTIRSVEDARCEVENYVASDLRFEVRLDPSSVNMTLTHGPQNDCGYRAELQAFESFTKTGAFVRDLGRARADSAFKKDHLLPYFLSKQKTPLYAASEAGLLDTRVMTVLAKDTAKLPSTLQYTTDRLAVNTASLGFIASLFARVGISYRLVSSTILFDAMSPLDTNSQQARRSFYDPTLPQLRRLLQEGAVIAFTPSTPVATLFDLQCSSGTGHFAWQASKLLAPLDSWLNLTTQITSRVMQLLLQNSELDHIASLVRDQAYQALIYSPPPPTTACPSSLFIHNFPAVMTTASPDMRALVLSEVLFLNDIYDLGLDTAHCEAKISAGAWVGGLHIKPATKDSRALVTSASYGMAFPLLSTSLDSGLGRIRECTGAERTPAPGERHSPAKISTTYQVSRLATSHITKLTSSTWSSLICIVRVCSGDTGKSDMSTVQVTAVRSYFHTAHQCAVTLLAYSFTHTVRGGKTTRHLPEVAMAVILEDESEFSLRTHIRNDLFGPTTKQCSIIKSHGGVEFELAQSPQVLLTQPPTQGPDGPRTLACPHMRCLISPDISRAALATLLTTSLPLHYSKGLYQLPAKENGQEFSDWVITVSPLFTTSQLDIFRDALLAWTTRTLPSGGTPLHPYLELHPSLEAFGLYEYYHRKEEAPPPTKSLPLLKAGRQDQRRPQAGRGSKGSRTSSERTPKTAGLAATSVATPRSGSRQAIQPDTLSPPSSLNTSTTSTLMVTKSYVDSLAEGIIAQTMAYATDRLEKSEAAMQRGLARQEAQLLQQADQLQTTTSTISVLHADLKAAELRSATTDSENKQVLATLNSQHLQLNDTLATMAALVRAQAQREELREQERVQERLRQDRSDEMLRQSLDQLGRRLTDQFPNQTLGGPGGPPPHPRPT